MNHLLGSLINNLGRMPKCINFLWSKTNVQGGSLTFTSKRTIYSTDDALDAKNKFELSENKSKMDTNNLDSIGDPFSYSGNDPFCDTKISDENMEIFQEIAGGDEKILRKLMILQTKYEVACCHFNVSPKMNKEKWLEFLKGGQKKQMSYLKYLISIAVKDKKKEEKRKNNRYHIDWDNIMSNDNNDFDDHLCYHPYHNSLFLKVRPSAMKHHNTMRGMTSMLHGTEIFFDCSYEGYMTDREIKDLCKQISQSIQINFTNKQPYHLVFCNFMNNSKTAKFIPNYAQNFFDDIPVTITDKSFLDFFPKEDLVYLTPHCDNILKKFDTNKRYIIGAFVDKSCSDRISLAKAKKLNLEVAKFPLDSYLEWGCGKKTLSLPHVLSIMLDIKNTDNDWAKAFQVIPRRFLVDNMLNPAKRSKGNVRNSLERLYVYKDFKM